MLQKLELTSHQRNSSFFIKIREIQISNTVKAFLTKILWVPLFDHPRLSRPYVLEFTQVVLKSTRVYPFNQGTIKLTNSSAYAALL